MRQKRYANINNMKRVYLGMALVFTFVLVGGLTWGLATRNRGKKIESRAAQIGDSDQIGLGDTNESAPPTDDQPAQTAPQQSDGQGSFRLIATGDFIAHDAINARAKDKGYNYYEFFAGMQAVFDKANIRYCNQSTPAGGEAFGISGHPVFNAPLQFEDGMAQLKCNMVNLASDHAFDKGQPAIDANVAAWKTKTEAIVTGMASSQEQADNISYATINNLKVAFLAYTTSSLKPAATPFGVSTYSQARAAAQITAAKQAGAFVVVGMRWGTEYSADANPAQAAEAQFLADQGADIILGGGPHVAQPVQKLARKTGGEAVVWYSLGNFFHSQLEPETNVNCLGVMDIDAATKSVTAVGCLPVYNHYEWPPADEARANLLGRTNFKVLPADQAADIFPAGYIAKKTTLQAQIDRLKTVSNKLMPVTMLTSADL